MTTLVDLKCPMCGQEQIDVWARTDALPACSCGGTTTRLLLPASTGHVIGDACDITIRHGICHEDGTPRHYTSKQEMRREAERRNLVSVVEHVPERGSDKSKHTSRWV